MKASTDFEDQKKAETENGGIVQLLYFRISREATLRIYQHAKDDASFALTGTGA